MSRLADCFERLAHEGRTALVPYVTAGDPHPDQICDILHALVRGGADVIEVGVPFSDPQADGPTLQRSSERALASGTTLAKVLDACARFRADDKQTPLVLMGYLNPFEAMGYARFAERASASGVDAVLTVDLPPEELGDFGTALSQHHLAPIFLVAPTTTDARLETIAAVGAGYLYYVSFKGVTGADRLDLEAVSERLQHIRSRARLPLVVGFGIRDAATAAALGACADGVVIGSALVEAMAGVAQAGPDAVLERAESFLLPIRAALDAGSGERHA
jgi:tryptophan synthase alpha chain